MAQALYRKYRPTSFKEVVNQKHIVTTLQNEIANKQFAQAYVFSGPRGIGKTTIARLLAKAINDESIKKHKLEKASLIDIIEIDAASHTGVDNVRENVIQNAYAAPAQLDYKVFIIDEVHMLSISAFNALLKILEEPPQHVVFIMATTEVHKIPATVLSRCQRFDFHSISPADIVKRLQFICKSEGVNVDEGILNRIARRAGGAIRDAESMLGQVLSINEKEVTEEQADLVLPRTNILLVLELFEHLLNKQAKLYLQILNQAVQDGIHLRELHTSIMKVLRQAMLYTVDQSLDHFTEIDVKLESHDKLMELMKQASTQDCIKLIDLFIEAGSLIGQTKVPQLPLETAGLSWCTNLSSNIQSVEAPLVTPVTTSISPSSTPSSSTIKKTPIEKSSTVNKIKAENTTKPIKANISKPDPATLEAIKAAWSDIVKQTKIKNHSLAMMLTVAHVLEVYQPNTLQLGLQYDFHKERICEAENLKTIEAVIKEVTGKEVILDCVVDAKYEIDINVIKAMPSDNIESVSTDDLDNIWDLAVETLEGEEAKK